MKIRLHSLPTSFMPSPSHIVGALSRPFSTLLFSAGTMNRRSKPRPRTRTSLFTIGHSNHPLDRFLALLVQHEIEALVDIRRFPGSRKHPHFSRDNLA
ncbi:MAG TPA: DUF488 family protein, partial [Gemmataceae bacterium]